MTINTLIGSVELGLIYSLLALGIFISFRILDTPDLTVNGSFVTGAAVSAIFTYNGHYLISLVLAFITGCLTGSLTTILHVRFRIHLLLAGILVMSSLYSINLRIMSGRPNIPLLNVETIFDKHHSGILASQKNLLILVLIFMISIIVLYLFFTSKFGMAIRATGNNEQMAKALGINTNITKCAGLALSNGLSALSGGILAHYQKFTDIGMGQDVIIVGLASVMIGEVMLSKSISLGLTFLAIVAGSVVYRFIISVALQIGMQPTDLKLITSLIVIIVLSFSMLNGSSLGRYLRMNNRWGRGTDA